MSGTPLQNNTFDIFAQMNFLNPGYAGHHGIFPPGVCHTY